MKFMNVRSSLSFDLLAPLVLVYGALVTSKH